MLQHPKTFGEQNEYRVLQLLGSGSYAHTYLVECQGVKLALKWLRPDTEPDACGDKRFENEKWALGKLNHPSIPRLIATGVQEDRPYIVMSFANGLTLNKISGRQRKENGTISEVKMLLITGRLLEVLSYIHTEGILHRDIKDANVVFDESSEQVTLLDLGMCKGAGQPANVGTFWNAGASRFSPPNKLQYPSSAHPTHDVFAVGVLGYLLLTNQFPWEAPDRGMLEDKMRNESPPRIHQINSMISRETSDFFSSLLVTTSDDLRPTAQQALAKVKQLEVALAAGAFGGGQITSVGHDTPATQAIVYPRVIRDPLHSDIVMTEFEWKLMNTREFQRLRWLRQLATANLVYPGAEHTRFAHAIGAMQVASTIMRRIEERTGERFEPEEWLAGRSFALVHDVSHIPYGHELEDEMGVFERHDQNSDRIDRLILSSASELGKLLRSESFGQQVLELVRTTPTAERQSWLRELVQAPCGADVLDYIDRDAYYCGLDHRIDSAVYRRFSVQRSERWKATNGHLQTLLFGRHGLRLDADFALETILRERFALYLKVYSHPVKIAAGAMIAKAVWSVIKRRRKPPLDEKKIEWMGDNELLAFLKNGDQTLARRLSEMILQRKLWKPAFQSRVLQQGQCDGEHYDAKLRQFKEKQFLGPENRVIVEGMIGKRAGLKADEVIFYCPSKAPGLQKIRHYVAPKPKAEEVRDEVSDPHLKIRNAHIALWTVFVFVPPDKDSNVRSRVAEASEDILGLKNELKFERKQLVFQL